MREVVERVMFMRAASSPIRSGPWAASSTSAASRLGVRSGCGLWPRSSGTSCWSTRRSRPASSAGSSGWSGAGGGRAAIRDSRCRAGSVAGRRATGRWRPVARRSAPRPPRGPAPGVGRGPVAGRSPMPMPFSSRITVAPPTPWQSRTARPGMPTRLPERPVHGGWAGVAAHPLRPVRPTRERAPARGARPARRRPEPHAGCHQVHCLARELTPLSAPPASGRRTGTASGPGLQ